MRTEFQASHSTGARSEETVAPMPWFVAVQFPCQPTIDINPCRCRQCSMVASIYQGMRVRAREKEEMPENAFDSPKKAFNYISGAAAEGNSVIVGRGAPFLLRGRPDTFHVFVYAPRDEKIRRLCEAGKSEDDALDEIENLDRQRVIFVRRYFGMEWPTRELYHLMINSQVGDEIVIDTILNAMHSMTAQNISADLNWAPQEHTKQGRS